MTDRGFTMTAADRFSDAFVTFSLYTFGILVVAALCAVAYYVFMHPTNNKSR